MNFRTPAFEEFVAPAKDGAAIWRLVLGLIIILVVYGIGVEATFKIAVTAHPSKDEIAAANTLIAGNTRLTMALILLSFSGVIIGVVLAIIALHRRHPITLFGPIRPMLRHFGIAVGVFLALQLFVYLVWGGFYDVIPQKPFLSVLLFLPAAAVLILIQTGAEEILFRGYLMQQLGARFKSPIIWFVLPPVAFGLLHYNPEMMGDKAWLVVVIITITGLLWTDLTRVTGNIGAAWGWHFTNNFMLMNFLGNSGELNGFVWMTTPYRVSELPTYLFAADMVFALVTWAILRRVLRD